MKCFFYLCSLILGAVPSFAQSNRALELNNQNIKLQFSLGSDGTPGYSVFYKSKPVVKPSPMGFILKDDPKFYRGFELLRADTSSVSESWRPVWGEVKEISNNYRELRVALRQIKSPNRLLNIVFRVFADGVGFRYEFPSQPSLKYFVVSDEKTYFNLTGDHKAFWIPGDYDTNEYEYSTDQLSKINNTAIVKSSTAIAVRTVTDSTSVQTPLMMKTGDGLYLNIHEAAQVNYPAMQLHIESSTFSLHSSLVPAPTGDKAYLHAPFNTPWRTIIVSDKATDILTSKMILNLNEPSRITDVSWIHPMKFVGVWWEMQTGKGGWNYSNYPDSTMANGSLIPNGKHSANTTNVKKYIDFAAENNIPGVLVEGWNTG